MATITLSIPSELKEKMSRTDWINWSSVARHAFLQTLEDLKELESKKKRERFLTLVSRSKFTQKDADELSEKAKVAMQRN